MILTGNEIKRQVELENISISPFNEKQLNPNSYNLRLGTKIITYRERLLDVRKNNAYDVFQITELGFTLVPGMIYLAQTLEETWTDKFVPMISGRSSVGRLGLDVHKTAGFGDVGFHGVWTLELAATQPITVYPTMEICQIYFQTILGDATLYEGKYNGASEVQTSRLYQEF